MTAHHDAAPWMITSHGRRLDCAGPGASAPINFAELAASGAKLCRYNGHTTQHYSINQHELLVAALLRQRFRALPQPEAELYALLHDSHEKAVMGDMTAPLQRALEAEFPGFRAAWKARALAWDREIHVAAGLVAIPPQEITQAIHWADMAMRRVELRDLFPETPEREAAMAGLPEIAHPPIKTMPWPQAEQAWLERFNDLQVMLRLGNAQPAWPGAAA